MALFGNFDDSYTKTGKGFFTKLANGVSFIPYIGGALAWPLGMIGTVIESAQWLFRGKFGSALTAFAAGTVSSVVNGLGSLVGLNIGSGIGTSTSLGTHARALTETVVGSVTGSLGSKPQVLASYPAAIGFIGNGVAQTGPGKFTSQVSAQRGQNADEAYARYMAGEGGVHVNELQSANGRGA